MKKRNKKLLLALGTVATVAAPTAAVVSCGSSTSVRHFNLLPTYTGQADQLIALGIHSDYYPLQLNTKLPFDYLTHAGNYMPEQSDEFKAKFQASLGAVMPKTQGVSWWNQDAKASDDSRVSNTYWQDQKGSVLLYEHYLLDDDQKIIQQSYAPKHTAKVTAETNFRASRDPYTRLPKGVFFGWDLSNKTLEEIADGTLTTTSTITMLNKDHDESKYDAKESGDAPKAGEAAISGSVVTISLNQDAGTASTIADGAKATKPADYRATMANVPVDVSSAKIIIAMRKKRAQFLTDATSDKQESSWFYNDWFFADSFHRMFLDNKDFQTSNFVNWMIDSTEESPFTTDQDASGSDASIKSLFDASTFTENEIANGMDPSSTDKTTPKTATKHSSHHPIYEQQEGAVGAAPMFEGAMRDNQLYLFNVAWQVSNLAKYGTPYGKQYYNELTNVSNGNKETAGSKPEADAVKAYIMNNVTIDQYGEMCAALDNANTITGQLKDRMTAMKTYFKDLGVDGKKFGMMTVAPGNGVSTIQTMSKYSFIYRELGFAQPLPSNLDALGDGANKYLSGWKDGTKVTTAGATEVYATTNTNLGNDGDDRKVTGTPDYSKAGAATTDDAQEIANAVGGNSLFNMDDNGWFWTLGETGHLDATRIGLFKDQFDMGVIAAREANYQAEIGKNDVNKNAINAMFATGTTASKYHQDIASSDLTKGGAKVNYDLWNEGIKTPFVMHMVLDQIMAVAESYAKNNVGARTTKANSDRIAAQSWGNYFTNTFTKN